METNIEHFEVSILSVIGIPIKLTLWIYLEKLERKFGDFPNQIEKLDRWQNLENWTAGKILKSWKFERLETNIPAFESV